MRAGDEVGRLVEHEAVRSTDHMEVGKFDKLRFSSIIILPTTESEDKARAS